MTHAEGHTAQNPAGGKRASTYTATPRRRSNEAGRQAARPGACAGALGHPLLATTVASASSPVCIQGTHSGGTGGIRGASLVWPQGWDLHMLLILPQNSGSLAIPSRSLPRASKTGA